MKNRREIIINGDPFNKDFYESEFHAKKQAEEERPGSAEETLKMNNHDLEYALNTLDKSPVIDYKKDRDYLLKQIHRVINRTKIFIRK